MADATDLKSVVRKDVRVRLPPSAPIKFNSLQQMTVWALDQRNGVKSVAHIVSVQIAEEKPCLYATAVGSSSTLSDDGVSCFYTTNRERKV